MVKGFVLRSCKGFYAAVVTFKIWIVIFLILTNSDTFITISIAIFTDVFGKITIFAI